MPSMSGLSSRSTLMFTNFLFMREAISLLNIPVDAEGDQKSLREVGEEIFADGQRTSDALESLGLKHLTNGEARAILAKRLEASTD